jgi:hypothetical protein
MKNAHRNVWILSAAILTCAGLTMVARAQVQTPGTYPTNQPAHPANQPARVNTDMNRPAQTDTTARTDAMAQRQPVRASEIVGLTVRTAGDQEKGKIKDLVIGQDGRIEYAAVSFGGFLGMGDKMFAVPWEAVHVVRNNTGNTYKAEFARIDVSEDTIKNRQGFDQDHWPDRADQSFLTTGGQRHAELENPSTPSAR